MLNRIFLILAAGLALTGGWGCARTCACATAATVPVPEAATDDADDLFGSSASDAAARADTPAPPVSELSTDADKLNYAMGYDFGKTLTTQKKPYQKESFSKGVEDGMAGVTDENGALLNEMQRSTVQSEFSEQQRRNDEDDIMANARKNRLEAEAFLEENQLQKGIVRTDSGLQYEVLKKGSGRSPVQTDRVKVHYRGYFLNGEEFDSSYARGVAAVFPVDGVVIGWTEALMLMKVGAKWRIWLSPDLAYGEQGAGKTIGPNRLLVFEIELLAIEPN